MTAPVIEQLRELWVSLAELPRPLRARCQPAVENLDPLVANAADRLGHLDEERRVFLVIRLAGPLDVEVRLVPDLDI